MNMKKMIFMLPMILVIGLGLIMGWALIEKQAGVKPVHSVLYGKRAPAMPKENLLGKVVDMDIGNGRHGEAVLVNFMASWCVPCRAEIPALARLAKEVKIIGIAYKDKADDTAEFLNIYGNPYDEVLMDFEGDFGIKWGIYGVPESFLIDGDGRVQMRHAGPIFGDVIKHVIRPALEEMK